MSWDIVIFNSKQKINSIEEIDDNLFVPIDFNAILDKHFDNILKDDDHREIKGDDYSINYFTNSEPVSNMLLNLYGENSIFEVIGISKEYGWQIFDTGNGQMIDLDHPEKNGYRDFQNYLNQVLKKSGDKS